MIKPVGEKGEGGWGFQPESGENWDILGLPSTRCISRNAKRIKSWVFFNDGTTRYLSKLIVIMHSVTILLSGLNISGAIQPSVPIAPVWQVAEFRPYASFLQSPKSDIMAFTSPLTDRLEIRTLCGLMSRWTEIENIFINCLTRGQIIKDRVCLFKVSPTD